jgi:hypothetical protein
MAAAAANEEKNINLPILPEYFMCCSDQGHAGQSGQGEFACEMIIVTASRPCDRLFGAAAIRPPSFIRLEKIISSM